MQFPDRTKDVVWEIEQERKRQVDNEGWSAAHDAEHINGELAAAAVCYALPDKFRAGTMIDQLWPWWTQIESGEWSGERTRAWWKPKSRRRDLVRAAALIVAEIERLDRAVPAPSAEKEAGT